MRKSIHVMLPVAALAVVLLAVSGCGGAEARKARYLEKGREWAATGNFGKARLEFRNALQIDPNNAEIRYLAGWATERSGNVADAAQLYQGALDSDPANDAARARLSLLHALAGQAKEALDLVEPGLQRSPDRADLLVARGAARMRLGETDGALQDAKRAVELAPEDEEAIALLASLHQEAGRLDEAIALAKGAADRAPRSTELRVLLARLLFAADRRDEAEPVLRQIIELEPKKPVHRYRLAQLQIATSNVDGAERTLRDAVAHAPESLEAKQMLVSFLASHRSFASAERELRAFTEKSPENPDLRLALGALYEGNSRPQLAAQIYESVVSSEGTGRAGLTARNRLAATALRDGHSTEAARLIAEVLAVNPRDADALTIRSDIALRNGDAPAAITDLRALLRDQPGSISLQRSLARAYLQNGDLPLAEDTLRNAIRANPTDASASLDLARLLAQRGRTEQAQSLLEEFVAKQPDEIPVYETLFQLQMASKDLEAARRTAQELEARHPEEPLGHRLAAVLQAAAGNDDAARRSLEQSLKAADASDSGGVAGSKRARNEALESLVRLDLSQHHADLALERLEPVIAREPRNAAAHKLRGDALLALGKLPEATAAFHRAAELERAWSAPYAGLARVQIQGGDQAGAIQTLQSALQPTSHAPEIVGLLAGLLERVGRADEAIQQYESLHRRTPGSSAIANNLAMLLANHRADAESLARAASLAQPFADSGNPAFLDTHGWVAFKRGQLDVATRSLKAAVEKSPSSPTLRYHLGMAQLKAGEREAARENLRVAVASGASFAGVEEARSALATLGHSKS